MLIFTIPLLMIWIGVMVNMPIPYYVILTVALMVDLLHASYRAGKDDDNAKK